MCGPRDGSHMHLFVFCVVFYVECSHNDLKIQPDDCQRPVGSLNIEIFVVTKVFDRKINVFV